MEVLSQGPFSVGVVSWQPRPGAYVLTVVCKVSFQLAPHASTVLSTASPVVPFDMHAGGDARRSLTAPSDLAPFKLRPEVFLTGHAYAPGGGRGVSQLMARVAIRELDKALVVCGDRYFSLDGELSDGALFTKMPLAWERAAGGPETINPVGVVTGAEARPDPWGRVFLPNLFPAGVSVSARTDVVSPAGFGPIAAIWPSRRSRLQQHAATWDPIRWTARPLPIDLDGTYFQASPSDQRVDEIAGDERILLENLHPDIPELTTRLPGVAPRAVVHADGRTTPLNLRCDTLSIDTDQGTATLTYRGQFPMDHAQSAGRVVVSQEASSRGAVAAWAPGRTGVERGSPTERPPAMEGVRGSPTERPPAMEGVRGSPTERPPAMDLAQMPTPFEAAPTEAGTGAFRSAPTEAGTALYHGLSGDGGSGGVAPPGPGTGSFKSVPPPGKIATSFKSVPPPPIPGWGVPPPDVVPSPFAPPPPPEMSSPFAPPPPPEMSSPFAPPPPPEMSSPFAPPPPPVVVKDKVDALDEMDPARRARLSASLAKFAAASSGGAEPTMVLGAEESTSGRKTLIFDEDTSDGPETVDKVVPEEPIRALPPPKPMSEEPSGDTSALPFRPMMAAKVGATALGRSMRLAPVDAPPPPPPTATEQALIAPPAIVSAPVGGAPDIAPPPLASMPVGESLALAPPALVSMPVAGTPGFPASDPLIAPPAVIGPVLHDRPPDIDPAPLVRPPAVVFAPPPTPEGQAPTKPLFGLPFTEALVSGSPSAAVSTTAPDLSDEPTGQLRSKDSASPEGATPPDLPLSKYDLARCARIEASLARRPDEAETILETHDLTRDTWDRLSAHHAAAIDDERRRGKNTLLLAQDEAYVAQLEAERGPIDVALHARIKVAVERGTILEVLREADLPRSALVRIQRIWLRRTLADKDLAAQTKAAVRAARTT